MSKNHLLLIIALIIIAIGYLVTDNLSTITIADIQYGDWEKITNPDGTFFYVSWTDQMSNTEIEEQHQAWLVENRLKSERVTGYGVRISRLHKIRKRLAEGRIHLFDTEETAIRFAKENDIPDKQIIMSNQRIEPIVKTPVESGKAQATQAHP